MGALAGAINGLLKRLLPVVLSFVGALVGIGKVVKRIQGVFKSIRKPAQKAITALFKRIKAAIKGLLKKLKKKFGKGKKGKGKKKYMSKAAICSAVISRMSKPPKAKDPQEAISETQALASSLVSKYQPRLKKGTLKIRLLDTTAAGVEKDDDIDLTVSMSPGKKFSRPVNQTLLKKFKTQISKTNAKVKPKIRQQIGNIEKSRSNITQWSTIRSELQSGPPVGPIVASPLGGHAFGGSMKKHVRGGVQQVEPKAKNKRIKQVQSKVNAGIGFYAGPKAKLSEAIFDRKITGTAVASAVADAVRKDSVDKPAEPYNRIKHYGHTPTKADRTYFGAGPNDVVDHDPPLVVRYYEGTSEPGNKPGYKMTDAERKASASDRSRMALQDGGDSDSQGGTMSGYSKGKKKEFGL